jgi:hypothetical protein
MMSELKGSALLHGARGAPGVDLNDLCELLVRVSRLAADFPQIAELDLNPVIAWPRGAAPTVADVRLRIAAP